MRQTQDELWRPPPPDRARLGHYLVRAEIGLGGAGAVYVAVREHAADPSYVAIKVARRDRRDRDSATDLRREAAVALKLGHPHLVKIVEVFEFAGGEPAVVMDYVHGESLASVASGVERLPYAAVAAIGAAIADALASVHADSGARRGIVHRDVSPKNVLIGYDGVPRLVDFGIAQILGGPPTDEAGTVRGRAAYMAPEQRRGEEVDGRADVYALGVVLYELAVGIHPWRIDGGRSERLAHPGARCPDLPASLWQVIARATEPEAGDRHASASELAAALRRCTDGPLEDRFAELAALLSDTFAERRREKERILGESFELGGDTELLPLFTAATARATPDATRSTCELAPVADARHTRRRIGGLLVAAVAAIAAHAPASEHAQARVSRSASPCVLVDASRPAADRDAVWAAARIVGIALDRAAGAAPIHGYRAQDRYGWTEVGQRLAEAACREHHADTVVTVGADTTGTVTATVRGEQLFGDLGSLGASAMQVADRVIGRLNLTASPDHAVPALDDRGILLYLHAREDVALEAQTPLGRAAAQALVHEYPGVEMGYLASIIPAWWAGTLDPDAASTSAAPPGVPVRAIALRDAVVALDRGEPEAAFQKIAALAGRGDFDNDPLGLYLAGESCIHSGRGADCVAYFSRAIDQDPQLSPALYHLFARSLAAGNTAEVEALARLRGRIDPSSSHDIEYRAQEALAAGDFELAIRDFEELMHSEEATYARLNSSRAGLVHATLLAGHEVRAAEVARRLLTLRDGPPPVAAVMLEPILYGYALGAGDSADATVWETRLRHRLGPRSTWTTNHWQAAYEMAILETLAGRSDAQARWIGLGPPPGLHRSYRYARFAAMLDGLLAREPPAVPVLRDRWTSLVAEGFARERAGNLADASVALAAALASSEDGEFDCIVAGELAKIESRAGDSLAAARACQRVVRPRVPRSYCYVLRRGCLAAAPQIRMPMTIPSVPARAGQDRLVR